MIKLISTLDNYPSISVKLWDCLILTAKLFIAFTSIKDKRFDLTKEAGDALVKFVQFFQCFVPAFDV